MKEGHIMAQIKGINPVIVPRIPYVPIEPWDWFKENGLEDKMGGPPPMGAGPEMTPSVYIKDGKRIAGNDATLYGGDITDTTAEDDYLNYLRHRHPELYHPALRD